MFKIVILFLLSIAIYTDLKKREISDKIPIIILVLSLFNAFFQGFLIQGLIGFLIFLVLALIFSWIMAGGDLKLIAALGASLATSEFFLVNAYIYCFFIFAIIISVLIEGGLSRALNKEFRGFPLAPALTFAWILTQLMYFF